MSARTLTLAAGLTVLPAVLLAQSSGGVPRYELRIAASGPGPQRVAVHPQLLAGGAPFRVERRGETDIAVDGLTDLRLFTIDGRPVPYLLVQPPAGDRAWVTGRVLPIAPTRKTSGFEVDLAAPRHVDMFRVDGLPVPYLKRLRLEGSGDRSRWTLLLDEATLFDLPGEKLRQNAREFEAGEYRYLRVTWDDANSARLPLPSSVSARRATAVAPPTARTIEAGVERRPSEPGRSRYRIRIPARSPLPIVALDVGIGGGHVYRPVVVSESRFNALEAAPVELGRAVLARVTREGVTASAMRVPIATPSEPEIELTIEDGDNEPLEVRSVRLELAQLPWIYFEAPENGTADRTIVARYGDRSLPRPQYDLEAVRARIDIRTVKEASWLGEPSSIPPASEPEVAAAPPPGPALDPAGFQHVRTIAGARGGLTALPLDAHVLANSKGPGLRFADVRILDSGNRQLPYLLERRDEPLSIPLSIAPVAAVLAPELKPSGTGQRSIYAVTLPFANLPSGRIVIETTARVFQRTVRLGTERAADRNRRDPWFDAKAAATWRHSDEGTPARPLTLPIDGGSGTDLRLVVDEGDNAPLTISAVRLLLPSYRLRFYAPAGSESLRLVYGRAALQSPQYDLALLAPRVMGSPAAEAETAAPSAAAPPTPAGLVSPRTFWIVLAGAVVVLLALIARLVAARDGTPQQ